MAVEWEQELFVHFGQLKVLPKVGDAHVFVSDVGQPDERVVALALDGNMRLLDLPANSVAGFSPAQFDGVE